MQILGSLRVLGQERGVRVRLPETLALRLPEIAWEHETPPSPLLSLNRGRKEKRRKGTKQDSLKHAK